MLPENLFHTKITPFSFQSISRNRVAPKSIWLILHLPIQVVSSRKIHKIRDRLQKTVQMINGIKIESF